ncbi:penicillin-binding protein activator LpoB [Campylobacter novaezeelandiae]|uniref:Penicillin-binding protein activator LpoB n=1 Tax=Campylobacter novaezeelandiae TaxID=2267891 RepID=A0A4V2JQN2_9BACT|nr:penicillin-binding protein activator LpoB [Campylobacter novaezeelandiae]QWU79482.1 outer membrane lipoprotein, putative peptidoglycan-synthase activator LpoB [Campylobacter novaezeelandiae]TBR79277.1 penicillin-binding protein activator LpoB [Campylobacter novaezeelandiae]TBR80218.1 penicillin-binding protein activator LpoB [Campylobacter novaezeelandiae]TBR81962.1 penicillin-binding protein activator LpoB [Campylobacter novaezeelandiae]
MKLIYIFTIFIALFFTACKAPIYTDGKASQKKQGDALTLGLDREDFEKTADIMVQSMLNDPAFANIKQGQRKVISIGKIINDTPQRIDTDKLISKITIALRKSGKFILTTAVAAGGAKDEMSEAVRELRDNDEFNQNTISKKGTLIAPDYSLSGKIRQDNVKLTNGKIQAEYFFHLTITDLNSGLAYWEDERTIDKTGSNKSVTW